MRSKMATCRTIIVLLWIMALLTGCWDQREIEERTSVVAIGIDRSKELPELYKVSVQIPIPIKIAGASGGGGGSGEAVKVMSSTGKTIVGAFGNLQKRMNQKLFYGHTRIIAIGEAVAREGVDKVMDGFRRDPQIRRLLWPLVVDGEAADILSAQPVLEQIPTVYIMSMIENGASIGRIPDMNLGQFYIDLSSTSRQPFLNYFEVRGDDVKWAGVAVFKEDQMIGQLTARETWNMMRVWSNKNGGNIVFPFEGNPEHLVTFSPEFIDVDRKYEYEEGVMNIEIKTFIEGDLIEKTFDTDFSQLENIAQLEEDAELYLEEATHAMITKVQQDFRSDILGIGSRIRAYHPDIWDQMDWSEQFPAAKITVLFDVKLRRTGMEMK